MRVVCLLVLLSLPVLGSLHVELVVVGVEIYSLSSFFLSVTRVKNFHHVYCLGEAYCMSRRDC